MSKNINFSENLFSQVNDEGLDTFVVYMINNIVLKLSHWELVCFTLKMDYIWKSDILRRTLWFMRIHCNWSVKRSCTYTYIYMWLVYLLSGGNWVACFVLVHCFQLLKLWIILYELSRKYSSGPVTLKFLHE